MGAVLTMTSYLIIRCIQKRIQKVLGVDVILNQFEC